MKGEMANKDGQIAAMKGLANREECMATMKGELANREKQPANREEHMATMEGVLSSRIKQLEV